MFRTQDCLARRRGRIALLLRHQHTLLFQHLRQRTILVHRHKDIAAANELLVDVELRYCGPLGVLLDACTLVSAICNTKAQTLAVPMFNHPPTSTRTIDPVRTLPQIIILQHIERCELMRIHALHAQNLYTRSREPALWSLGCTLHKQYHRRRSYSAIDRLPCLIGE